MDPKDPSCWDEMKAMRDDWDSYGANRIRPKAIDRARELYEALPHKPDWAVPLAEGAVQFEWDGEGLLLEVEVHHDGLRDALLVPVPSGKSLAFESYPSVERLIELAGKVRAGAG
jgi:hypothetical protein